MATKAVVTISTYLRIKACIVVFFINRGVVATGGLLAACRMKAANLD